MESEETKCCGEFRFEDAYLQLSNPHINVGGDEKIEMIDMRGLCGNYHAIHQFSPL